MGPRHDFRAAGAVDSCIEAESGQEWSSALAFYIYKLHGCASWKQQLITTFVQGVGDLQYETGDGACACTS